MTTSLVNADLLSWPAPNYLTEAQVVVLENGAALPEPAVLGNKCAAYRVWADVLQPIQSESQQKTLRYVGRYQEGAASLGTVDMEQSTQDDAVAYDLYMRVTQPGTQYFAVEADDKARLVIPAMGVDVERASGSLNINRGEASGMPAGFYRISELSLHNILYGSANAIALKVSHDTEPIPDGDYSGSNTFSRSFSTAPDIELYVLLKGQKPQKKAVTAGACSCRSEGSSTATCGCAVWDMAFGLFPNMADMPAATVGLFSDELAAKDFTPAALRIEHPILNTLSIEGDTATVTPQYGAVTRYSLATGKPLHDSAASEARVRTLDADFAADTQNPPVYLEEVYSDYSAVIYPITGGAPVRIRTAADTVFSVAEIAAAYDIVRGEDGVIRQIYAASTGLLTVTTYGASAYMLSLYPLSQVGAKDESGLYTASGSPLKTVAISGVVGSVLNVIEDTADGVTTRYKWTKNGAIWHFLRGTESAGVTQVHEQNVLSPTVWSETNSFTDAEGNVISAEQVQYRKAAFGQVVDSRTLGYGAEAQTTRYLYGEIAGHPHYGRVIRVQNHNGSYTRYEYDAEGRIVLLASPTAISGYAEKGTRTTYATARFNEHRPATEKEVLITASGTEIVLSTTSYAYEDSDSLHKVTITRTAAGSAQSRVRITERFGMAAALPYARGRVKFEQQENGVQTWHSYEATQLHGAAFLHCTETRVEGGVVNGQSRRTAEYIAANGTVVRTESYALTSSGEWCLLEHETYTYDTLLRETSCTRGNGRVSSRVWMCCGLLSETDEDGVVTLYNYDSAKRLIGMERSATATTPATVTAYNLDTADRRIGTMTAMGEMVTSDSTAYDSLGRMVSSTDVLGRVTTTVYSADDLVTTVTTPAGATTVTTRNTDGSTVSVTGTAQRARYYTYDLNGSNLRTTETLVDDTIIGQSVTDGFGQTVMQAVPSVGGHIYTRSEYNARGQLIKQYTDTGWNTAATAPMLYEYDGFGNITKQTLSLADTPTANNSPVEESAYGVEAAADGEYAVTIRTRYNAAGEPLISTEKRLISELSATLASKSISINERGNISTSWSEYTAPTKVTHYSEAPTSDIIAETLDVDGFTVSHTDHAGITTTASRSYTATGMVLTQTDGRGNTTTIVTDLAGRTVSVTDAAGNTTTTAYDTAHDLPAVVTDALQNTACYQYDHRGRKTAEWGTAIQPACYAYDDADNMTMLKTFRAGAETISSNPSERTDADITTWEYHASTGLELRKTYADGTSVIKTYDAYNRLATETDARGNIKTHSYEHARGLHLSTSYTDNTLTRQFSYNHLGQIVQITDAAGARTLGYNSYGEQETDSLLTDGVTHLITENRDTYGRNIGYTYAKNGVVQQTVNTGYGTDGRISTAGFQHGGESKIFSYTYLPGSNLLQILTKPNGMTQTYSYETSRDLLTHIAYHRGNTLVTQREYVYDTLGRPTSRSTARQGSVANDSFTHNTRSELTAATVNNVPYQYAYDNIGNRLSSRSSAGAEDDTDAVTTTYVTNSLNQYTSIQENEEPPVLPEFDADGNQTRLKTATGIWSAVYDTENRPTSFTNTASNTVVECAYDSMGRRSYKKVTVNGEVTLHQRYIYRGYLQIACCDITRSNHPCLWLIMWDSTQPIATRPLAIQKDGTWYTYGLDLTKNVCEVFGTTGYIATTYAYSPYGEVTANGSVAQPIQWSSEFIDDETELVYYNYRYYSTDYGKWCIRDFIPIKDENNLYAYCLNSSVLNFDEKGARTKQQKEADRAYAKGINKTGRMLNKEKSKQEDIAKLANKATNVHIGGRTLLPASVSAINIIFENMNYYNNIKSMNIVVTVMKNIQYLCSKAKRDYDEAYEGQGCCSPYFTIRKCFYNFSYHYNIIKYKTLYRAAPCKQTEYMDINNDTIINTYVKFSMVGDTIVL